MPSDGQKYWSEYFLNGFDIKARPYKKENFCVGPKTLRPHFWKDSNEKPIARHRGYAEARDIIGRGKPADFDRLSSEALRIVAEVFSNPEDREPNQQDTTRTALVKLRLSDDLERWKNAQKALGYVLPPKKPGLTRVSKEIQDILKLSDWPEAVITNNAFFGCGIADMLIGAADAPSLFSNYVTDMAFYYEHGYHYIYPSLGSVLEKAQLDPCALQTKGGRERREAVKFGKRYIQGKIDLEERHKLDVAYKSARINRRDAQITHLMESSVTGMGAEAIAYGFDPAAVFTDLLFSSPGTDVVDVGSDLVNSEVMNSFLNVKDVTDTGVITEEALRRIYDAFSAVGARTLTERWHEPLARIDATLYSWHIVNDRHMFLRRVILGWPKARKGPARPQYEADFDEAFDEEYRTTGFSRPLDPKLVCDGQDTCNLVEEFLAKNDDTKLLEGFWYYLVLGPLEYVRKGQVDEKREEALVEGCRVQMSRLFSSGQILEMTWLLAHANHHAWQVNYMFEAAMFGSFLDGGELIGKLDRQEEPDFENPEK